jgi:hypothetical protein
MPRKDPEARRQYHEEWKARRHTSSRTIVCGCGCGKTFKEYARNGGGPRSFLFGHRLKAAEGHVPQRILKAKQIVCECGCGQTLADRNRHGNKQRYIYGHASNRVYAPVEPPPMASLSSNKDAERSRASRWARKITVLKHYGGDPPKCACLRCGEHRVQFLAIDHINRDGAGHRRALEIKGGNVFYGWLVKNAFPPGFRVLCHNCNMAIGIWGTCPHEVEKDQAAE